MGILTKKKSTDDAQRFSSEVVIENRNGLHARPAAMFVKISGRYRAEVWVEKDGERVNGKSIMGLMMLAAAQGTVITLEVDGVDEEAAMNALKQLIADYFGEEE